MFTDLFTWKARAAPAGYEHAFVRSVHVAEPDRRAPQMGRFILTCWLLIAVKHVAVIWAVAHYHVPFHQLWVNAPTWLLGALATGVYYLRGD
jgi:hypothetical protein